MKRKSDGFTLIELLMVVGIIGVLAGMIAFVIKPGELAARGRDSKRQADLEAVASALTLYKVDQATKVYPYDAVGWTPAWSDLCGALSGYIDDCPGDPKSGWSYGYCVDNGTTPRGFRVEACYESADASVAGTKMAVTGGSGPPANCSSNGFVAICP